MAPLREPQYFFSACCYLLLCQYACCATHIRVAKVACDFAFTELLFLIGTMIFQLLIIKDGKLVVIFFFESQENTCINRD